jgi:hypothetical protein
VPAKRPLPAPEATKPQVWEFAGADGEVYVDRENPFNAEVSVRITASGGPSATKPGILQREIALKRGERYTLSFYARGSGSVIASLQHGSAPASATVNVDQVSLFSASALAEGGYRPPQATPAQDRRA